MERSLLRPVVGGSVRVSRGAAFLFPQAAPASPAAAAGGASLAPPAGSPQVRWFATAVQALLSAGVLLGSLQPANFSAPFARLQFLPGFASVLVVGHAGERICGARAAGRPHQPGLHGAQRPARLRARPLPVPPGAPGAAVYP